MVLKNFTSRTRTQKHNIIVQLPGLRPSANLCNKADPVSSWNLLFSENILQVVLQWTNIKLQCMRVKYKNEQRSELHDLDMIERLYGLVILYRNFYFQS